jgi:hypothetical protein
MDEFDMLMAGAFVILGIAAVLMVALSITFFVSQLL